jgi:L-ascorbate metabolism protein UlaG (beta-lactamase superfamily)
MSMSGRIVKIMMYVFLLLICIGVVFFLYLKSAPQFGAMPHDDHLAEIRTSSHYIDDHFYNDPKVDTFFSPRSTVDLLVEYVHAGDEVTPQALLPTQRYIDSTIGGQLDGPFLTWFGHSTFLYEIGDTKILFDPMLGSHASPFPFGVKRYNYKIPFDATSIPDLDFVIVSHDHYDHLDYSTIISLQAKVKKFLVPLGVGAHLQRWGVPRERIEEFDWGDVMIDDDIAVRAVQSQHYSGRTIGDRQKTLWAAWIIDAVDTKVFFGGDSGYFDGFKDHGRTYGPFDLTLLDSGQYHALWQKAHMTPEDSVQAHQDLRGDVYMPIHWSGFTLSVHPWTEPVERALEAAEKADVEIITPMIGERFHVTKDRPQVRWWEDL